MLTALLNEIAVLPDDFVLVLDDYHAIDAKPVMMPSPSCSHTCRRRCIW